jgi:hypothetical protein
VRQDGRGDDARPATDVDPRGVDRRTHPRDERHRHSATPPPDVRLVRRATAPCAGLLRHGHLRHDGRPVRPADPGWQPDDPRRLRSADPVRPARAPSRMG